MNHEGNSLSVVVLGYNVELYIRECLDSILNQTYTNIQVIMIDDGGSDDTGLIMDSYSKKYDNFHVIHQENMGPSAGRNKGVSLAETTYIAYVDGDDIIPENAYESLMTTVEKNDADMAVGAVLRFDSKRQVRSFLHKKAIKDTDYKTSIELHKELVYDTTSWNKVYNLAMLRKHKITFPEGLIYEDIPYTMHAHLAANHINIIEVPVYKWRWREGHNESITQNREDIKQYTDRLTTLGMTKKIMKNYNASKELTKEFEKKVLAFDIPMFIEELKRSTDSYISTFHRETMNYLEREQFDLDLVKILPPDTQLLYQFLFDENLSGLVDFLKKGKPQGNLVKNGKKYSYKNNKVDNTQYINSIDVACSLDLKVDQPTLRIVNTYIEIESFINLEKINLKRNSPINLSAKMINVVNGKQKEVNIKRNENIKKLDTKKKTRLLDLMKNTRGEKHKGVTIYFDYKDMYEYLDEGTWKIEVRAQLDNLNYVNWIANPKDVKSNTAAFIDDKVNYTMSYNYNWEFFIQAKKEDILVNEIRIDAQKLKIDINSVKQALNIELKNTETEELLTAVSVTKTKSVMTAEFDTTKMADFSKWKLLIKDVLTDTEYSFSHVNGNEPLFIIEGLSEYLIEKQINPELYIQKNHRYPRLKKAEWINNHKLSVEIDESALFDKTEDTLILHLIEAGKKFKYQMQAVHKDGVLVAEIDFLNDKNDSFIMGGKYDVWIEYQTDSGEKLVRVLDEEGLSEPIENKVNSLVRTIVYRTPNYFLRISNKQVWGNLDNTQLKRRINYSIIYPFLRLLPLRKKTIVFDSYWASAFNCNPKAIYDLISEKYPEYKAVWVFKNPNQPITGNAKKVRLFSFMYWYYIATSKYFVENTNMPNQYEKRTGQVEVQTLHGTFMKTMGFDEPYFKNASRRVQNNFAKRVNRWDYLISPSPYMSDVASKAFDYKGEILESGFPRNDYLYAENTVEKREQIKQTLKLDPTKKILLYAPTYRQKSGFNLELDIKKMQESLSDDYQLLVRLHYFIASKLDLSDVSDFAIDVSSHRSIEDLYLISDALITDYSSVMFDYGHLKRPMLFFAYDLEEYSNEARGVYLDYDNTVPGPIVFDTDSLIAELSDFSKLTLDYKGQLNEFYELYCTYGHGNATQQVVEAMLFRETEKKEGTPLIRQKVKRVVKFNKWYPYLFNRVGRMKRKDIIVFESFFGRNYSDNPKAIYEYMKEHNQGYKLVWNVNEMNLAYFKENNIPYIVRFSFKGILTMARAKYWVVNTRIPLWLKKPEETTLIQTWHGTPLKKLGVDIENITMPGVTTQQYHGQVTKDSSKWNKMISPNRYSTDIFKSAFQIEERQMINSGYPRNDILVNESENVSKRKSIISKLDIPTDKKIILYAPTWRDNEFKKIDHYTTDLKLDLERLKEEFCNDVVILIRAHYLIANELDLSAYDGFAYDVSNYQDIQELYLVSDMLITDYSSVFFDYAILKRPMIFFAYDLDDYGEAIRGFYFDYRTEAPGPVITTNDEVIIEIKKQLEGTEMHANYPAFIEKYCQWEHGNATEKVVSIMLNSQIYESEETQNYTPTMIIIKGKGNLLSDATLDDKKTELAKLDKFEGLSVLATREIALLDPLTKEKAARYYYVKLSEELSGWVAKDNVDVFTAIVRGELIETNKKGKLTGTGHLWAYLKGTQNESIVTDLRAYENEAVTINVSTHAYDSINEEIVGNQFYYVILSDSLEGWIEAIDIVDLIDLD